MNSKEWEMIDQLPRYGTEFRSRYVILNQFFRMEHLRKSIKKQIYTDIFSKLSTNPTSAFSKLPADLRNALVNHFVADNYQKWNEHSDHLQCSNQPIYSFVTTPQSVAHTYFSAQDGTATTYEQRPTSLYVTASEEHNQNMIGLIGGCFKDNRAYPLRDGQKKYHVFMTFQNHLFSPAKNQKRFDELLTLFAKHLILHEKNALELQCSHCIIDKQYHFDEWETDQYDRTWHKDSYRDFFGNRDDYADMHPAELRAKSLQ